MHLGSQPLGIQSTYTDEAMNYRDTGLGGERERNRTFKLLIKSSSKGVVRDCINEQVIGNARVGLLFCYSMQAHLNSAPVTESATVGR